MIQDLSGTKYESMIEKHKHSNIKNKGISVRIRSARLDVEANRFD